MGFKPSCSIHLSWSFVILPQSSSGAVLLLTGSAGAGKTATIHVLANELGFEVQEWINPLSETDGKSLRGICSYKKGWGCLSEILKRTPKRYQGPVLWAWLEFFSPLSGTDSKTTHYLLPYFFGSIP